MRECKYKEKIREFEELDADELNFELVSLKNRYEQFENRINTVQIILLIVMLVIICRFLGPVLEIAAYHSFAIMSALFLATMILTFLLIITKEANRLEKELLIIETICNRNND